MLRPSLILFACISLANCGGGGGGGGGGGDGSSPTGSATSEPPDYYGIFSYVERPPNNGGRIRSARAYTIPSSRLWYVNKDEININSWNQTWAFTTARYEPITANASISEMRRYYAEPTISSSDASVNFRHLFSYPDDFGDDTIYVKVTKDTIDIPWRLKPQYETFGLRTHERVHEGTAALSKISGAYVAYTRSSLAGSVDYSINISTTGEISGYDTQGCSYEGSAKLENAGLNLYPINISVTNCVFPEYHDVDFSGEYSGIIAHVIQNGLNTLTFAISSENHAMYFEVYR